MAKKVDVDKVTIVNGKKTVTVHPVHAKILLKKGWKLAEGQRMPSEDAIRDEDAKQNAKKPFTRKQLEAIEEKELGNIYYELKGIPPTVDHNKAKLIEDIIILQEDLK